MKQPLVSIVMPAYNAEKFIEESIKSVINQSYKNWELLVINDCSKDFTQEIIKKYCLKDKRIELFNQERNSGVVEARNKGIQESKGKYIAFLDSDDLWEEKKLEIQIKYMEEKELVITYTSYSHINEEGDFIKEIIVPESLNYSEALRGNQIGCLTVIVNKNKVENFQMPNLRHEDYATWLNILKKDITAYGIRRNLAKYRKVNNSISSNKLKTIIWTWRIFRKNEKMGIIKSSYFLIRHLMRGIKKHGS